MPALRGCSGSGLLCCFALWAHLLVCARAYLHEGSACLLPPLLAMQQKGAAAGMMALAYQIAHIVGLSLATLLVFVMVRLGCLLDGLPGCCLPADWRAHTRGWCLTALTSLTSPL